MSDRIEGEESPDLGISSAQSAILDMLSPSEEDTAEDSEERVDEFSEEGEVLDEAAEDHIFGVPIFVFKGEQFWGADRLWLLEETLKEAGLARNDV